MKKYPNLKGLVACIYDGFALKEGDFFFKETQGYNAIAKSIRTPLHILPNQSGCHFINSLDRSDVYAINLN